MFFTYVLRDPETNQAFYVGKGKGNRPFWHIAEAQKTTHKYRPNKYKMNKIRTILAKGLNVIIQKIEAATDQEAIEMEMLLISMYGRRDIKTGILTNCTEGGDGACGYKHTIESKQNMSKSQKGKVLTEEHKANMRKPKSEEGRKAIALARQTTTYRPSEETKKKTSLALKGRPSPMKGRTQTEEAKLKMSKTRKGVPKIKVSCPKCSKSVAINTANRWHFNNCKTQKEQYVD
jgi:hypothetical protein